MSTTLSALVTMCKRDFYDSVNATNPFTDAQIEDMIGQGISAVSGFYPAETLETVTITAGTYSYDLPEGMTDVFRAELYDTDGSWMRTIPEGRGGPNSGWRVHGGTITIPQWTDLATGQTLQLWGYGSWAYIDSSSSSTATTDLDTDALWAVRVFVQVEELEKLVLQRSNFPQWDQTPGSTDVTSLSLRSIASESRRRWQEKKRELASMRKTG